MAALIRSLRSLDYVTRVHFHAAAVSLVREPTAGMRSPGEPSTNQAGSASPSAGSPPAQNRERTEAAASTTSSGRTRRTGERSTALSAADTGERGREERGGGGGLLPFGQQFPSLTSLLPSPIRSLFGRSGRDRDMFSDLFRDPFFSPLLPLSPALPLAASASANAPAVSRGVWDVDAELANPIQGVELEETDDAYVMKTKLSPAISKKVQGHKLDITLTTIRSRFH